jgi:uncharacterized protein YrzB (UPF0473 family)
MSEPDDLEVELLTLPDEDGNEREFALLTLVNIDEGTFAVLAPATQLDAIDSPDLDLYAFRWVEEGEDIELDAVEDDEVLDRIFAVAEEMLFSGEE